MRKIFNFKSLLVGLVIGVTVLTGVKSYSHVNEWQQFPNLLLENVEALANPEDPQSPPPPVGSGLMIFCNPGNSTQCFFRCEGCGTMVGSKSDAGKLIDAVGNCARCGRPANN